MLQGSGFCSGFRACVFVVNGPVSMFRVKIVGSSLQPRPETCSRALSITCSLLLFRPSTCLLVIECLIEFEESKLITSPRRRLPTADAGEAPVAVAGKGPGFGECGVM
jgi:hypothetical protein